MNTIWNLDDDSRKTFKKFCEHVIQDDERLHQFQTWGLDPMKAMTLTNLVFDEAGWTFLRELYELSKDFAFENKESNKQSQVNFFQAIINEICHSNLEVEEA